MKDGMPHDSFFIIDGRLIGINEIINAARTNKFGSASQKKSEMKRVSYSIKKYPIRDKVFDKPVIVEIIAYEPDKRRDVDNILGGINKIVLDSIVECGIIPDDSQKYVHRIIGDVRVDKKNPRIEVYLTEE